MNGAQSLIKTLVNGGVDVCFTNPGTSEMHFVAALDQVHGMRAVLGLFEGICTGAADGYARMTGKPASTLLHLGPGLGNGIANLHNARRARSPIVNIIGEHATYHIKHDAPLNSDIEGLAAPVSGWVKTTQTADEVSRDTAEAITASQTAPGQIATLILPGDASWNSTSVGAQIIAPAKPPTPTYDSDAVKAAAALLHNGLPTLLLMSGKAVLDEGGTLASRIATATGCKLMSNRPTARRQLGAGRPKISTLAYPIDASLRQLEKYAQIILVGTAEPVAFFAYPNMPSRLASEGCHIHTLATPEEDVVGALAALAEAVNAPKQVDPAACYGYDRPPLPNGPLSLNTIWQGVGSQLPKDAVIVNESITSGWGSGKWLRETAPYDMLLSTGGSIGWGIPNSVGAAVACPDRQVINMQADGAAMYTLQGFWTQARENLNIVTVIFNNRAYKILQGEFEKVGAEKMGPKVDSLFNIDRPQLDFVTLAQGMGVESSHATSAAQFNDQLAAALKKNGPHLIEVLV